MRKISILLLALLLVIAQSQDIFSKYYSEARKIAEAMTLDQLVGQMVQADFKTITN